MSSCRSNVSRFVLGLAILGSSLSLAGTFPDYGYAPPADWNAATFRLSQQYPDFIAAASPLPWQQINFRKEPEKYLRTVLAYCFEGNLETEFVGQQNAIRHWYHAPWLHYGTNGRDFVRGLTRERDSLPFELSPAQTQYYRNFAIGFYNESGGFTIGQVWKDPLNPDASKASFPEGTVAFKLLFTTAPVAVAPFLEGAPEWVADIDRAQTADRVLATRVRLLQVDIDVKDRRSRKGGWVFGSFHYDAAVANANPWLRLRPLALMWGDDPALVPALYRSGAHPAESWINGASPIVKYRLAPPAGTTPPRTLGRAGRGNGPVDNPASSCLSCHSTAQTPALSPMVAPATTTESEQRRWFRNTKAGEAFDAGATPLDFSLQLSVGIQNLNDFRDSVRNPGASKDKQTSAEP